MATKKTTAKKPAEEQPAAKAESGRKAMTINAPKKKPLKKADEPVQFENRSQNLAFEFAERMKRKQEEEDLRRERENDIRPSRRPTTRAKGQNTLQFPAADLEEFRKRLILLRQETLGQSATLRTVALEQTNDHGSEDDDGADAYMRLQNLDQANSQNRTIQMIDEALQRIEDGTYGICEQCGQLIRKPRLLYLPFVRTCIECQTDAEKTGGTL